MYRILCYCNYLLLFFSQNNKLLIAENASRLSNLFTSIYSKKHLNKIALYAKNIRYGANALRKNLNIHPNVNVKKYYDLRCLFNRKVSNVSFYNVSLSYNVTCLFLSAFLLIINYY